MVRYPENERWRSPASIEIFVRRPDGTGIPITELAEITVTRGYSEINRLDQQRSITISAELDTAEGNAQEIIATMRSQFFPELLGERYPAVSVNWEGQQKQTMESLTSLIAGCAVAPDVHVSAAGHRVPQLCSTAVDTIDCAVRRNRCHWGHGVMGIEVTLFSFSVWSRRRAS